MKGANYLRKFFRQRHEIEKRQYQKEKANSVLLDFYHVWDFYLMDKNVCNRFKINFWRDAKCKIS